MLSTKPDPAIAPAEVFFKTLGVLWEVMRSHGVDHRCGRLLPGMLVANGLSEVGAEGQLNLFRGASAGGAMLRANFMQMHDEMIATGHLTEEEFQADLAALDDPAAMWPHGVMWSVWGRRP